MSEETKDGASAAPAKAEGQDKEKAAATANPVPPVGGRVNDGTEPIATPEKKETTAPTMTATRRTAPDSQGLVIGRMGISTMTRTFQQSEQYGYLTECASIHSHCFGGLGVMTTQFLPRMRDAMAYDLGYLPARVRVLPAIEQMVNSSIPKKGLAEYEREMGLFYGEVRGILLVPCHHMNAHFGKPGNIETWDMSTLRASTVGVRPRVRPNPTPVGAGGHLHVRSGHANERIQEYDSNEDGQIYVANRAKMTLMSALAEADLLNCIYRLYGTITANISTTPFRRMVVLYREALRSKVRDMTTAELIDSAEVQLFTEFMDLVARLDMLPNLIEMMAGMPWIQTAYINPIFANSLSPDPLANVPRFTSSPALTNMGIQNQQLASGPYGIVSPSYVDPDGQRIQTRVFVFQSALMQMRILLDRIKEVLPKIITQRINLVGNQLNIPQIDLLFERLEILLKLLDYIPAMKNMTNCMIFESMQIRSAGNFSSYILKPVWHRVAYAVMRPIAQMPATASPFIQMFRDNTMAQIGRYPVYQILPSYVVDRAPHGMMAQRTLYRQQPTQQGNERATALLYTNVNVQQLGWMLPVITPIEEDMYDQFFSDITNPTARSYGPIARVISRWVAMTPGMAAPKGGAAELIYEPALLLPLAPFAIAGAPVAQEFVFQPVIKEFREMTNVVFKHKGPMIIPAYNMYPVDAQGNGPDPLETLNFFEIVTKVIEPKDVLEEKIISWLG